MVRVTYGAPRRRKKNRFFKRAAGFVGGRHRLWRTVRETVVRAWAYSTRDRRQKKRNFRSLWIVRINAAARANDITYNRFIQGLRLAGVTVDRKVLADLAVTDEAAFAALAAVAKDAVAAEGTGGAQTPAA